MLCHRKRQGSLLQLQVQLDWRKRSVNFLLRATVLASLDVGEVAEVREVRSLWVSASSKWSNEEMWTSKLLAWKRTVLLLHLATSSDALSTVAISLRHAGMIAWTV